jgi:single-strand selective monofunctional uracil DNA glycosylase
MYLNRYGQGTKKTILVGMNPGPFGMTQTGVPFGEIEAVRGWMGIEAPVAKPRKEHPKRPVLGFACTRSEVSGKRLWGWAAETSGTAERFFKTFFVINYCPLVFMGPSGVNITPDKLPLEEREPLFKACDKALRAMVQVLQPSCVVGVGAFAEGRVNEALEGLPVRTARVLHPSPASPAANKGWAQQVNQSLRGLGLI